MIGRIDYTLENLGYCITKGVPKWTLSAIYFVQNDTKRVDISFLGACNIRIGMSEQFWGSIQKSCKKVIELILYISSFSSWSEKKLMSCPMIDAQFCIKARNYNIWIHFECNFPIFLYGSWSFLYLTLIFDMVIVIIFSTKLNCPQVGQLHIETWWEYFSHYSEKWICHLWVNYYLRIYKKFFHQTTDAYHVAESDEGNRHSLV